MKILLLTQEPPLVDGEVVSGNAVRTRQIRIALENAGHQVVQAWLKGKGAKPGQTDCPAFRNRDELLGILMNRKPEAIVVSYWELLGLLPHEIELPVVLDYVAPRPLEELYESPQTVKSSLRRLKNNLQRCDLLLVGNELQRHLMINTLIESGFDLRREVPVRIVPLGSETVGLPRSDPGRAGWLFVTGGVSWPWRETRNYQSELDAFIHRNSSRTRLVQFGGRYRWHEPAEHAAEQEIREQVPVSFRELEPYREFSEFLLDEAHVGVELADRNIEREYSQSFRSLEYLRHGLPLLCNRYLPISRLIEEYDAGWIVDDPASLESLLPEIISQPDLWQKKSSNALKLVSQALHPDRCAKPLLSWLESPLKAPRLQPLITGREEPPVLGVPPLLQRIKRQFGLARKILLNRVLGQERGAGLVLVTRGDLFPPDHGAAVRTLETARALARREMVTAIVTDDRKHWYLLDGNGMDTRKYPPWVRLLSLPGPLVKLLHFSKDIPHSNSFLYLPLTDSGFYWRTIAAARCIKAGVLQAEFPAYAHPCIKARDLLNCGAVLVEHNVEYDRIRAQVQELTDEQYETLKSIEIDLCSRSDAVVCVSDNDRQKLEEDGVHPDILHTVPHGVDLAQYDTLPAVDVRMEFGIPEDLPLLVFHGTFSYPPNQQALRIFAEILLPGLEEKGLVCHLLAVGRDPPQSLRHPRIHFTGSVDRVGPWLRAADISLVPLVDGGGTRMKIIDCFAASLPVISTSKGIEGIPVESGRQALILDDWDSVIDAVIDLWENPDQAAELARGGRSLAENLDWDAIAEQYQSIYSTLP
jgi:glycosyltransferase involved in cell wall biosynthesis